VQDALCDREGDGLHPGSAPRGDPGEELRGVVDGAMPQLPPICRAGCGFKGADRRQELGEQMKASWRG